IAAEAASMALGDGCPASRAFLGSSQVRVPFARAHATGGTGAARRSKAASLQISVFDPSTQVCLDPALCSLANGGHIEWPRPQSARGGQQWPSPPRLCRFGERALAHVIREAFCAQADRQILVWKSGRQRYLRLTCRLVGSSWSHVRPTTRSVRLVRHPGGTSAAAEHGTPSYGYGSGRSSGDCCHPRVKPF